MTLPKILHILSLFILLFKSVSAQVIEDDSLALVDLYQATNGSGWTDKTGWEYIDDIGSRLPVANWFGVKVTGDRVTELILNTADMSNTDGNNLIGTLPAEIGNLTGLIVLNLDNNQLSGSIPPEIGNLVNLQQLVFGANNGNQLTGSIPIEIGNLVNLTNLGLFRNDLSGNLPAELGDLVNLTQLTLQNNNLTGSIPPELGNLSNLFLLGLGGNNLTESIPPELGNLSSLTRLFLSNNQLSGTIPPELENTNLFWLTLNDNNLTGSIPPELGNLPILDELYLANNQLSGSIPPALANATTLTELTLNNNLLSGSVPSEFTNLTDLTVLNVSNNDLSSLPDLTSLSNLTVFDVSQNFFSLADIALNSSVITNNIGQRSAASGVLESDSSALVALYNATNGASWFNSENWLSGDVSTWSGITTFGGRVTSIELSSNNLTGTIPSEINNLDQLNTLGLARNNITGNLPNDLSDLSNIQEFKVGNNDLSGQLPDYIGDFVDLTRLGLSNNNFTGFIPTNYNQLVNLDRWNISYNQLDSLPDLSNLTQLSEFIVSSNRIDAEDILLNAGVITQNVNQRFPISVADSLILVDIYNEMNGPNWFNRNNWLETGTYAAEWYGISTLDGRVVGIDLPGNNLTGIIPDAVNDLDSLKVFGFEFNNLESPLPAELSGLTKLEEFRIGQNDFSGQVPDYIGTLSELRILGLAQNEFTGFIPTNYNSLTNLDQFNIRENAFDSLPDLTNLTALTYFDVSRNRIDLADLSLNSLVITTDEGQAQPVLLKDSLALVALYNSTDGANWNNHDKWLQSGFFVELWHGITVQDGRVHQIELASNNLTGTIPDELNDLDSLRILGLARNNLSGSLPANLSGLTKLGELKIGQNNLSGQLPDYIGDLLELYRLGMAYNGFTGFIPSKYDQLVNMDRWNIRSNLLDSLPDLSNLTQMTQFDVSNNYFDASDLSLNAGVITQDDGQLIPTNTADVNALIALYDSTNGPQWFNRNNWLQGDPVTWNGITIENERVTVIELQGNNLTGTLPDELNDLDSLRILGLAQNDLSGPLPTDLSSLTKLQELKIGQNDLSGSLPEYIGDLTDLTRLGLSQNAFTGFVPTNYNQLTNLDRWNISSNRLDSLPDLSNLTQMSLFNVSFNLFDDADLDLNTAVITQNDGQLESVSQSDSLALVAFYIDANGPNWFSNNNWLESGSYVKEWFGISVEEGRVTRIELANNNLSGTLPPELNGLTALQSLGIARNNFSGTLPDLAALTNLQELKIGRNNFTGTLPDYISGFAQLNRFGMSNNQFSGSVPASYANLNNLGNWNISSNNLTGLPDLRSMTQLGQFIVSFNQIPLADIQLNQSVITENEGQIGVQFNIDSDTTWSGTVITKGGIFVEPGVTLTINPGTIIKSTGLPDTTYLAIARGAVLNAVGTADEPIIFTTTSDDIEEGRKTGNNLSDFDRGYWGGLIILGDAEVSEVSDTGEAQIEGISFSNPLNVYGGSQPADNSGTLQYLSIRHSGLDIGGGNFINGLTLAGVGSGTIVDNIEIFATADDGIEWFGGTVTATNLIVNQIGDDGLDTDQAYAGTVDNFLTLNTSDSPLELDGPEGSFVGAGHLITNGTISGTAGSTLIDVDDNTDANIENLYFFNLGGVQNPAIEDYGLYSINNNGYTISNLEATLPIGTFLTDYFNDGSDVLVTEVAQGANTVGATTTGFDWTYSAIKGELTDFGINPPSVPGSDSSALVALYNATDGPNWFNNSNWLSGPVETWYGITVVEGRVDEIKLYGTSEFDFNGNNLTGTLPTELGNLTELRVLDLGLNNISGTIPTELEKLAKLEFLNIPNINGNGLTGSLPTGLGKLTNLVQIELIGNNLTGSIPSSFGNLSSLSTLGLANNQLSGAVPSTFTQLTNLTKLNISGNSLEDLPDLSSLIQLSFFDVSFNRFGADDITPNLSVITVNDGQIQPVLDTDSLALLDIYNALDGQNWLNAGTWLTDTLVALWEGVGVNNGRVERLDLNGFGVNGDLPAVIANLDALETLGLANNQITGIPPEIDSLTNLRFLFLDNNQIDGPLLPEIGSLINLEQIYFQQNNFSGPIPTEFNALTNLQVLWLSENQLSGEIPTFLGSLPNLQTINLSNNNLSGQIPAELNALLDLSELLVGNNGLSGSLPDLMDTQIEGSFDISGNRFSMGNLLALDFDSDNPLDIYNDQEFIYTVDATSLTPGAGSVTLTVTNSVSAGNEFQWYKDGEIISGATASSISLAALTESDDGLYTCIITNPTYPGLEFRSESYSLDVNETERKYGFDVTSFSSESSSVVGSATEILGVPNSVLDFTSSETSRAWKPDPSGDFASITVSFDGTANPINSIWIYGDQNTFIDSVLVRNPSTSNFERVSSGGVIDDPNGLGFAEAELNFPTTPFNVSEVRLVVRSRTQLDAIAIGENGLEINIPQNLFSEIVADTIFNIGWSYVGTDSANFSLERSIDGIAFSEIASIDDGFSRFSDRNVPQEDTIYYRVKAIEESIESFYSEVLVIPNCGGAVTANIPEGSWTGTAEELTPGFDPDGGFDPNVSFTRNQDGTITINDFNAGYLDNFNATPVDGILSEACDGSLQVTSDLSVKCAGEGIVSVNYIEFFPSSDSLVIEYTFNCGNDIRLTYVKNPVEPAANPPQNLEASVADASTIRLTWQDVSNFEDEWVIERSVGNSLSYTELAISIPNPQLELSSLGAEYETYYDNTVTSGTTYFYRIRARNSGGDSDPSNEVSVSSITPLFNELTTGAIIEDQPTNSYSGVWGDYDGDGDQDLYVTNWHINFDPVQVTKENYLYQNNTGVFSRVSIGNALTDEEFTSRGAVWGDFNNDGDKDIFVLGSGPSSFIDDGAHSYLFRGDGAGGFIDNTDFPSLAGVTTTASDMDGDGNLDIILNDGDFIQRGLGDGNFAPLGENSGGAILNGGNGFPGFWTALTPNINNDSLPDLFFASDNTIELYENLGDFDFNRIYSRELTNDGTQGLARGAVFGDFDHNGYLDIVVADREKSVLLLFNESGLLAERTDFEFLGEDVFAQRGLTVLDYDNDGNEDLVWILDDGQPYLFSGNGDGTFNRVGDSEQIFPKTSIFSSFSKADYNGDGYEDLFLAETDASRSNVLFTNAGGSNNFLRVDLSGTTSNRLGIDAQIRIKYNDSWRMKQVATVNGLWSSNEITAHFGLGSATVVDSVEVKWPSGLKSFQTNVSANQTIEILELSIPVIAIDSIVTDAFQPEITGRVSDLAALIEVELEGNTYNAINRADSTWFLPGGIVDSLFNGEYEVIARATNMAGVGTDTTTIVIDQKAPLVTIDSLVTNQRSPELTGTVNDLTAVVIVEIDKDTYIATNNLDSTWALAAGIIDPPLEDGTYDVIVTGSNVFGDSTDTTTNEVRLDATPPTVFVDNIGTSITSPELTGFIDDFTANFTVNVAGRGDFVPNINTADSTWSIAQGTITPAFTEADNPITLVATAEDSLLNESVDIGELIISNTIEALEASRVTTNSFRANWSSVVDAVNYNLEIARDDAFTNVIASIDTLSTSYEFEDAEFETDYFYRVTFDNGVDQPTTSNEVSLKTEIKPETVADFDALLEIAAATNASVNWNLDLRKQGWNSIELVDERVVSINLSENTLENTFPLTRALTELTVLNISDNSLIGIDSLAKLRSIETLNVEDNFFDFGDLEPLVEIADLVYGSQKTRLTFNEFNNSSDEGRGEKSDGDTLKITVFTDTTLSLTTNGIFDRYNWIREDAILETNNDFIVGDSTLRIQSIDYNKMGKFRAEVENDNLPELTIPVDSMFVLAIAPFTVNVLGADGNSIPEEVDGFMLLTEQRGAGFDTLSRALNQTSPFTIDSVILGDYLVSVDSDREKYIPTYYSNAFEWTEADTIEFRNDDTVMVNITVIPPPPREEDPGVLNVVIEEDFGDDEEGSRIDARRRAKQRKCGLRRRRTGGRTLQEDDEFELFAYGETDDNGEFQFGFLPEGEYRFFVEYPGIPIDESSFIEFTVGEQGISDTEFSLSAFATEDGVAVEIQRVLGVIFEYFKDLRVYPNPVREEVKVAYRHLKAKNVAARMIDLSGNELWSKDIRSGYDGFEKIDVSDYEEGIYLLQIYDKDHRNSNVVSYRIIVRK